MTITLSNISKSFSDKIVLKDINYTFNDKNLYFLVGPSGKGKSTILSILGLLDTPTSGDILFNNKIITDNEKDDFIKEHISFVFQDYNLFDNLNVYDNFSLYVDNKEELIDLLNKFNLDISLKTKVKYLSGGEKQRLSILRALIKGGDILLFDEPTGNLDKENSILVFDMIKQISKDKLCIVVSHDIDLAISYGDYILNIDNYTLNEYNDTFILDFKNEGSKALNQLNLYLNSNIDSFILTYDKEEIVINKDNQLETLNKIYQEYKDQSIKVKIKANTNKTINNNNEYKIEKHSLKIKQFLAKYSLKNFTYKVGRAILSVVLMSITLSGMFFLSNLQFYDIGHNIESVLKNHNVEYSYIINASNRQYDSFYSNDILSNYDKGFYFYPSQLDDKYFSVYLSNDTFTYQGKTYQIKSNNALITDYFLENVLNNNIVESLSLPLYNIAYSQEAYCNVNIIDDTQIISTTKESMTKDCFIVVNKDYYISNYATGLDYFVLNAKNPISNNNLSFSSYFVKFSNQDVSYGNPITKKEEIILYGNIPNYNEYLNKTFLIEDLNSLEKNEYYFSLSKYLKEVNVVGIINDETYAENKFSIIVNEDLFSSIANEFLDSAFKMVNSDNSKDIINRITIDGYTLNAIDNNNVNEEILSNYYFNSSFGSIGYISLLYMSLNLVLLFIFLIVLLINTVFVIKDNYRQIAIIKSLGINNKNILISKYITVLSPAFIALILSYIFGCIITYFVSISNASGLNLLPIRWFSFLIVLAVVIVFSLLFTLLFIKKITNVPPYQAMKEFK